MITQHGFTAIIKSVLEKYFEKNADDILNSSYLVQYLNEKTKSASRGSKARNSFGNIYSLYVLVEDYIKKGYNAENQGKYSEYEGAVFTDLLKRQRELPFGSKLQNHSLNSRTNSEFSKYFPTAHLEPIIRDQETRRYWINENLLIVKVAHQQYNIAAAVVDIIDSYIKTKQNSFETFIAQCKEMQAIESSDELKIQAFIKGLLAPNVDARLFEIVSFSILKYYYNEQHIYWGYEKDSIVEEYLRLYKTGRTNANDGGIDFVMKPLGKFFQVTETLDFTKYFLDIDKLEKYPITFVIKSEESEEDIKAKLRGNALKIYPVNHIVEKYMRCIEEIINIPKLMADFDQVVQKGLVSNVLEEIILQSKVEFNQTDDDDDDDDDAETE